MPNEKFIAGLKDLGVEVEIFAETKVTFDYVIEDGKFKDKKIKVGFEVPPDFEATPPTGPHLHPQFLPMNEGAPKHPERVAPSPFGNEWQYLSRPYPDWPNSKRTVKVYMQYVTHILNTL